MSIHSRRSVSDLKDRKRNQENGTSLENSLRRVSFVARILFFVLPFSYRDTVTPTQKDSPFRLINALTLTIASLRLAINPGILCRRWSLCHRNMAFSCSLDDTARRKFPIILSRLSERLRNEREEYFCTFLQCHI